jgi:hypothetical protein
MRINDKLVLMCVAGLLTLCAMSAASASAASCTKKAGSAKFQLCINGGRITEATTAKLTGAGTTALVFNLNNWAPELSIECTNVAEAGESSFFDNPTETLAIHLRPIFSGCRLTGKNPIAKKCTVNPSGEFVELATTLESPENSYIEPRFASVFWEWTISKNGSESCPVSVIGGHAFGGTYGCTLKEAAVELVEHELKCASSTKHQTYLFGTSAITPLAYTEKISLRGTWLGAKYSIYESA